MKTRNDVVKILKTFIVEHSKVLCAWEGGSAATDDVDAFSDLDVMVVVEEKNVDRLFKDVDALFEKHFGVREAMRVEEPAWHGFSQKFYDLENTEPWFYVDFCVLPKTIEDPFTASDRHGEMMVWKDAIDFIDNTPTAKETIQKRAKAYYARATKGNFVLRKEIDKAFRRGRYLDAYHFLYSFLMRSLAPLLNIEHRVAKVDFGLRYAKRDYSLEDYGMVLRFFQASDIEELKDVAEGLFARYEELKKLHAHDIKKT